MDPKTPIENLPGVGNYFARKLKKLEIETVEDLIYHFPFRYDDFSKIATIANLTPGEKISIQGVIWQIKNVRTRTGKFLTVATVADQSATIEVIWFNQPYLTKTLKAGQPVSLSGKIQLDGNRPKLISPSYEILRHTNNQPPGIRPGLSQDDTKAKDLAFTRTAPIQNTKYMIHDTLHTGRLVPIYAETEGLSSKWLRNRISNLLPIYLKNRNDFLPANISKSQDLVSLEVALSKIHFPNSYKDGEIARKRLAFDEIFLTQLLSIMRQAEWQSKRRAPSLELDKNLIADFVKSLPFELTNAQKKAIDQLLADLSQKRPANRLLEGDVGSGKTVVAAAGALIASANNFDTLIAAPTEILAFQHQKTLTALISPFGIKVGIWTKSKKTSGDVTCGTHALLTTFEAKRQVGLVVVDEQHRFGVAQRAKLFLDQAGKITPHILTMTATPTPSSLALPPYADLIL